MEFHIRIFDLVVENHPVQNVAFRLNITLRVGG